MDEPQAIALVAELRANSGVTAQTYTDRLMNVAADEIEALRAALAPFSGLYEEASRLREGYPSMADDRPAWGFNKAILLWGDFRRAREAFGKEHPV